MKNFFARNRLSIATLGCAAALTLGACTGSGSGTQTATPSTAVPPATAAPSGSTSPSQPSSASAAPSASGTDNAEAPRCAADGLTANVSEGDAAAGNIGYTITLTNATNAECTLDGHPGVSAVGQGNGTQIGNSATRTDQPTRKVMLAPGAAATATLRVANIGADGGPLGDACTPVAADGWRIYPPGSTDSIFVAQDGLKACKEKSADWLTISVVEPAS